MADWEFRLDAKRRWYWRRILDDGSHGVSSQTFESRDACVADAAQHGFARDAQGGSPSDGREGHKPDS